MSASMNIEELQRKAAQGDAESEYELGEYYEDDEIDYDQAEYWLRKAVDQGYIKAYVELAYLLDVDVESEKSEAVDLMKYAAEHGDADAISELVMYHDLGYYVEPDLEKVFHLYRADVSDIPTSYVLCKLGQMYEAGQGTPKNMDKALVCYTMSAQEGSPFGLSALAVCYAKGKGVIKDHERAWKLINRIEDVSDDDVQQKIIAYKALVEDDNDPEAELALRRLFESGRYDDPDIDNIYALYNNRERRVFLALRKYSRRFRPHKGNPLRQFELAQCYRLGRGVRKNEKKAMYWLKQAASNGNEEAQKMLKTGQPVF